MQQLTDENIFDLVNVVKGPIKSSRAHSRVNSFEYNVSGTSSVPILRQNWFNMQLVCPVFFYLPRQGESDLFGSTHKQLNW
jgi:hypothetical protein